MIDIGVNLLNPQFDADRDAVLERAWQAGIEHLLITGTDLANSAAAAATAAADPHLSATVGIHPHAAAAAPPDWPAQLRRLAARSAVVAIGETGLDFYRNLSPPDVQEQAFRTHLALAAELDLPVFVHDRDAGTRVAACIAASGLDAGRVVVHCFTGHRDDLERYLALGCHIGITGWVCDRRRGADLRALVPDLPLERLMIETDAPYLRPHTAPGGGRRNEPALLVWVARQLAELYDIDPVTLQRTTAATARRFFGIAGT